MLGRNFAANNSEDIGSTQAGKLKTLSVLVNKAKGYRTINQFAWFCRIQDADLIENVIMNKITYFPSAEVLRRIAEGSEGRVTYNELRTLCGYSEDSDGINLKDIKVKRGEIYMCYFGDSMDSEMGSLRPIIILQNDIGNYHSTLTTICPISTKRGKGKDMQTHVAIGLGAGLINDSEVLTEHVRTVSKRRLLYDGYLHKIGEVSEETMRQIESATMKQLGIIPLYIDEKELEKKIIALRGINKAVRDLEIIYTPYDLLLHRKLTDLKVARDLAVEELRDYCALYNKDYKVAVRELMNKIKETRQYTTSFGYAS